MHMDLAPSVVPPSIPQLAWLFVERLMGVQLSGLPLIVFNRPPSMWPFQLLTNWEKVHVQIHSWLVSLVELMHAHNCDLQFFTWQYYTECTNSFVQVVYRETSSVSIISCEFLNRSDTYDKLCCVAYIPCNKKEPGSHNKTCGRSRDSLYNIQLEVIDQTYDCYTVTASNDTYTVKVEGTFTLGTEHESTLLFIIFIRLLNIQVTIAEEVITQLP